MHVVILGPGCRCYHPSPPAPRWVQRCRLRALGPAQRPRGRPGRGLQPDTAATGTPTVGRAGAFGQILLLSQPVMDGPGLPRDKKHLLCLPANAPSLFTSASRAAGPSSQASVSPSSPWEEPRDLLGSRAGGGGLALEEPRRLLPPPATPANLTGARRSGLRTVQPAGVPASVQGEEVAARSLPRWAPPPPGSRSASPPHAQPNPRPRAPAAPAPAARGRADAEARARAPPMRHARGGAVPRPG